jgi:hypothetical protein
VFLRCRGKVRSIRRMVAGSVCVGRFDEETGDFGGNVDVDLLGRLRMRFSSGKGMSEAETCACAGEKRHCSR